MGSARDVTRVGLVLGAGGLVGQAYQAGVLAALQVDLGWDARGAELVVGTSAGSLTGAMLRLGASPFDLASFVIGQPWNPEEVQLEGLDALQADLPPLSVRMLFRRWQAPQLGTWLPVLGHPWGLRPLAILSSMLPTGKTALDGLVAHHLGRWSESTWPERLWVCAVRRGDGRRIVFGQGPHERVPLTSAVAASSCIPGYFMPVTINGDQLLDGGIHSPTNADLLVDQALDVVVVISPMSGGVGRVDRTLRGFARKRLASEIHKLEQSGTPVVTFEPGPVCSRLMGFNPMARSRLTEVLQAAFFESGALAAQPDVRHMLAAITVTRD